MSKEKFINEIEDFIKQGYEFSTDAIEYFEAIKSNKFDAPAEKKGLTPKSRDLLIAMRDNLEQFDNIFATKKISEVTGIPSRSISGSMRSLVTKGYVEKVSAEPVLYALTEKGKTETVEE